MEDGLRTIATSDAQRQAAIRDQLLNPQIELANKDPDTAFLVEFLGGLFGLLGIGYLYSGLTNAGLIRLFALWAFLAVGWTVAWSLSVFLIGFCLMPPLLLAHLFVAYKSADDLKKSIIAAKAARGGGSGTGGYLGSSVENPIPPLYGTQEQEQWKDR